MHYWRWLLGRLTRQLWWRAAVFGLLGVFTAIFATIAEYFIPWRMPLDISPDAVETLLSIIASSMLAVTTFSLGAMTSAFGAATSNVTPRATKLLMEDRLTHNVLSSFIGAFLFSIVGIIVLKLGSYGDRGRAVLFVITIVVIGAVVVQLFRWINHLISLGRVGTTTQQVEEATRAAISERLSKPYLGGNPWHDTSKGIEQAIAVRAGCTGYFQFVDMPALSRCCEKAECEAFLPINPGTFVYEDTTLVWIVPTEALPEDFIKEVADLFVVDVSRSFDQDPRFGLAVMSEIGSRALSPATNDPGTALDVIGRQTRLLALWATGREDVEVEYPRLHVYPLSDDDLLEDAFMLMARDGAGLIEVQLRLQKSLAALQRTGSPAFRAAARKQATLARERSYNALTFEGDIKRLRDEVSRLGVMG